MNRSAPAWLAEFQSRFGSVLRSPLGRASGTLTAMPETYDARITEETSADRLAVYNRQYWFRLFDVLHGAFPLTARLFGYWEFNEHAAQFLLANPPRGWDLDDATEGFDAFFIAAIASEPADRKSALIESTKIDAAWHRVLRAPLVSPFRPSADDAAHLLGAHLTPSPAVAFVEEHFALLELRKKVLGDPDRPVVFPVALAHPRAWAIVRTDEGVLQIALEAREMRLFMLLREFTVSDSLARLERECSAEERAALPTKARAWLARSVEKQFWIRLAKVG